MSDERDSITTTTPSFGNTFLSPLGLKGTASEGRDLKGTASEDRDLKGAVSEDRDLKGTTSEGRGRRGVFTWLLPEVPDGGLYLERPLRLRCGSPGDAPGGRELGWVDSCGSPGDGVSLTVVMTLRCGSSGKTPLLGPPRTLVSSPLDTPDFRRCDLSLTGWVLMVPKPDTLAILDLNSKSNHTRCRYPPLPVNSH